jgi:hypothetical protein
MNWKKILLAAGYSDADATRVADELTRQKVTEKSLPNLPRSAGMRFMGFSTYKIVHDLTANADYLKRIAETMKAPEVEPGVPVVEQFYNKLGGIVDLSMIAQLREIGATPETVEHINEEAFEEMGIQKSKLAKIQKLARDFTGS